MTPRVTVKPELLQWACKRIPVDHEMLHKKFPKYTEWKRGTRKPTLKQMEDFARFTRVPIATLFMPEPMDEKMPIQDFRTVNNQQPVQPSADLLDTVYMCQQRQDWYWDFAMEEEEDPLPFVGSATLESDVEQTASDIRMHLGFDSEEHKKLPDWTYALRYFTGLADTAGILVMTSSVVGNNSHRRLDPQEFRGFALSDELAPLVFVNASNTKATQIFTFAHGLAHIWLGKSELFEASPNSFSRLPEGCWCSQVAAELLLPALSLHRSFRKDADMSSELQRLSHQYKVSTPVVLRRLYDIEVLSENEFLESYQHELSQLKSYRGNGGSNFYTTLRTRVGYRFAAATIDNVLSGQTSFTTAFHQLGINHVSTLDAFAESLREK